MQERAQGSRSVAKRRTERVEGRERDRDTACIAQCNAAASVLSIPRLSKSVPTIVDADEWERLAQLALALRDLQLLRLEDVPQDTSRLTSICTATLKTRISKSFASLNTLGIDVDVAFSKGDATHQGANPVYVEVRWSAAKRPNVYVAGAARRLERYRKGLAASVLDWLEYGARSSLPVSCVTEQRGMAEYVWWSGCSSPEEATGEMGMDDDEAREFLERAAPKEKVHRAVPDWLAGAKKLELRVAEAMAKNKRDSYVRAVGEAIVDLMRLRDGQGRDYFHAVTQESGGAFVGWGAVLRWSRHDLMSELLEEIEQYEYESGEAYDICGQWTFSLSGENLAYCLDELDAAGRLVRNVDRLITLLGKRRWAGKAICKGERL